MVVGRDRYTGFSRAPPLFEYSRWAPPPYHLTPAGRLPMSLSHLFSCRASFKVLFSLGFIIDLNVPVTTCDHLTQYAPCF